MQLRLQRTQRAGGLTGGTILFCLDVRADYDQEERSNINRYKLGGQAIYNSRAAQKHLDASGQHLDSMKGASTGGMLVGLARGATSLALAKMQLNVSIASLGRGHHIECKDLDELLEAEDTIRTACKNLTKYLEVAATFDGSEIVVEYENGEERVHITQHAPPLIEYRPAQQVASSATSPSTTGASVTAYKPLAEELGAKLRTWWLAFEKRLMAFLSSKGWNFSELQVRAACGVVGLVLFIAFIQIV